MYWYVEHGTNTKLKEELVKEAKGEIIPDRFPLAARTPAKDIIIFFQHSLEHLVQHSQNGPNHSKGHRQDSDQFQVVRKEVKVITRLQVDGKLRVLCPLRPRDVISQACTDEADEVEVALEDKENASGHHCVE